MKNNVEKIPNIGVIQKQCEDKIEQMFGDVKDDIFEMKEALIRMQETLTKSVLEEYGSDSEEYKIMLMELEKVKRN